MSHPKGQSPFGWEVQSVTPTIQQLFDDYNYYRAHTHHYKMQQQNHYMRACKLTPDREQALSRLIDWCLQEELDARRWMAVIYYRRKFLYAPRWDQLTPKSKATRKLYETGTLPLYDQRLREEQEAHVIESLNPNRDIIPAAEILKDKYLKQGLGRDCITDMRSTYGYHPLSLACRRCPVAHECREVVKSCFPFDVLALREGRVTWPEVLQLLAGRGSDVGRAPTGHG